MTHNAENDVPYTHHINVNVGGSGQRPVVTLWCMDCLVTVRDFDQVNPWREILQAVAEHSAQPSRREVLARPIPPAADWDTAFPPIRPHTCHIELGALYAGQRDPDCAGCRCIPPGEGRDQ